MKSLSTMNMKLIGYWTATSIVAFELVVGDPVVQVITQLGYPVYLLTVLGVWKLLGAVALLAPRFLRLKEWAYVGTFFEMTGALMSHVASAQPGSWGHLSRKSRDFGP
ncbi:MAG TPA: DoxX family protein [Ktedonobacterales bacterium]|jgi:uncharacterized membrane protein YphA (DoxX/SURF4 family)